MSHFKIPEAPKTTKDMEGAVLHRVLKYDVLVDKLKERIEDIARNLDTIKHTITGLRDSVNDAANARLLRSRRETLRNSEACAAISTPVLAGKLLGLVILFAGLLAVKIVDAAMYNDSKAFGAVSIAFGSVVEMLTTMCEGVACSGSDSFTSSLSLLVGVSTIPYALCWWFLAWLILKVSQIGRAHV
jgi:hypothetical protein